MSYSNLTDDALLKIRPYPESYPADVLKNIQLLSFRRDEARPFGSYIYKIQKYPGDIDLTETFKDCCTISEVAKKFAKRFQYVVKKLTELRSHYVTEAKIGEDNRFAINLPKPSHGVYNLTPKDKEQIFEKATELFNRGLLKDNDYETIGNIILKNRNNTEDYDILENIFRNYRVIRWSPKEILQGFKILPGRVKVNLENATKQKGHLKIDTIIKIGDKFIEMTNFVFLILEGRNREYVINLGVDNTPDLLTKRIERELPYEIERLFYSKYYYNPFKGVKRLWALARHYRDFRMIDKLKNFISGNISLLYQLKSDIENSLVLLNLLPRPPITGINNVLQQVKSRLSYVLELDEVQDRYYKLIDAAINAGNKYQKIKILDQVKKEFVKYINYFTIKYLDSVGLTHFSHPYLPNNPVYSTQHILPYDVEKVKGGTIKYGGCAQCGGESFFEYEGQDI